MSETAEELPEPVPGPKEPYPRNMLEPYVKKRFEWRVEGCNRLVSATEGEEARLNYFRKSPKFRFMKRTWFLQLYPNIPPSMYVFLCMAEGDVPIAVSVEFGIVNSQGFIEWRMERMCRYVLGNTWNCSFDYRSVKTLITKVDLANRMSDLAKDDVLTIVCNLSSQECVDFFREFVYDNEASIPLHLLPEARPSNMLFIVQDINMVVDYNILRFYCPNIASMVQVGGTYRLDYDPRTYRQFLLYLYTGKIATKELNELLLLYDLASSYEMDVLRDRCVCLITAIMEPDNAISLLIFFENRREKHLTAIVYKFIFEHASQVLSSVNWMEFLEELPLHANEICRLMAKTYKKGLGLASSEVFCQEAVKFHSF